MSYEEEFDKIVQQKANEAEYAFDENNWAKTSRLLDQQRRTASKLFWKKMLIPAGAVVVVGITTAVLFSINNNNLRPEEKNLAGMKAAQTEQPLQNPNEPAVRRENNASHIIETVSPDAEGTSEETKLAKTTISKNATESVIVRKEAATGNLSVDEIVNQNSEEKSITEEDLNDEIPQTSQDPVAAAIPETKNSDITNADNFKQSDSPFELTLLNEKPEVTASTESETEPTDALIEQDVMNQNMVTVENLSPYSSQIQITATDPEILFSPLVILPRYEDDYFSKKRITHYLNLEAGAAYLLGWNTSNGQDGKGLNWFGGINYGYYICPKTSISLGLQLYNVSNIVSPFYNKVDKAYGFGYSNSYTSITTDNLYYAAIPLKFNYHLNSYNSFGIGLNAGYLVKAHSRVDNYTEADGLRTQNSSVGNNKIYNGTNNYNLMVSCFYSAKINQRLGINAEFTYGLSDIFENNHQLDLKENSVGLRLSLNYYLFNK